jgi:hypothetical protein
MMEVDESKVEIKQNDREYGVFALQDILQGETVYAEVIVVSHIITLKDMNISAGDSCLLVRKIFEYQQSAGKKFYRLGLKTIRGLYEKPSRIDKEYLKAIATTFNVAYKKVLEAWRIVCTYHLRATYKPSSTMPLRYRIQLSNFVNRTNHSCDPNVICSGVFTSIEEFESETAITKAVRPIKKGEEVKFLYLEDTNFLKLDVKSRRQFLKKTYGFICMCERCVKESKS